MNSYDTKLTPTQEAKYKLAAKKAGRIKDTANYDLRGAWLENPKSISGADHLTDKWKKPNHPTFSTDSKYSTSSNPGGTWVAGKSDSWSFTPSKRQIGRAGGLSPFKKAFNRNEADQKSGLVIPPSY
jgi:hypothetical protein